MLMTRPVVVNERELAATSIVRFNHQKHLFWYWVMFFNQLLNAWFAGGIDFSINLYLHFIIICIEFVLNLLGARLRRFGHEKLEELVANQTAKDYKVIVELIKHHIEAGE